jgi:ribosomal protein S18 acetylase RimI-like enzyme
MPPITVRIATEQDVKLIKNLSWQTFFDAYHQYNSKQDMQLFLETSFSEEAVRIEMADKVNTFIIASLKKDAVGYAKLSEINKPKELDDASLIEVSRIYALKEKVGSGVGKALMTKSVQLAQQKGKALMWLGVWEHNQRAIQFYRRWGFEKFGEQIFYLGNDKQNDWLMKKDLNIAHHGF